MMKFLLVFKFIKKAIRTYFRSPASNFIFQGIGDKTIHVLGNGPSLRKSLDLIGPNDDVMMVNFAILTDLFFELKPRFLSLADPYFFMDTGKPKEENKKIQMLEALGRVDWNLEIVVPSSIKLGIFSVDRNNISVKYVNTVSLDFSVKFMRFWLFKKNFTMPSLQNVIVMGIYVALQKGYKTIFLHGVDSDSYKNICINQNNEMLLREFHYYGVKDCNLNDEQSSIFAAGMLYKRLQCEVTMFRSYIDLADYAKYLGVTVINASQNSMIDAFMRYDHKNEKVKIKDS